MKISSIPTGFKSTSRYSRPGNIKTDTHHLYTTEKYIVEIVFHSAMFYAPEFYKVSVKSKAGEEIWSGGESMFLDSLFRNDFVSDVYDRMILTKVNSTESSNHMQVIMIDLKTRKEEVLTVEGYYHLAGHFISFDGIYYSDKGGVHCIDYGNNSRFVLHHVLDKSFKNLITWGVCVIKDCILLITCEEENNLCLFNLQQQQVIDRTTFHWETADSVSVGIGYVEQKPCTTLSVSYSDRQSSGALKHRVTEYFNLDF